MDPLTHTLVGANLAATRLREKTRLATAALVIGANLPDVDSILYYTGHQDLALGFRRGWTHGVLAIVLLPLIQTGLLLLYARLRPDPERPVSARWLLLLSFGAILTHPFLDWLNNYGMRWLMPFDGRWFYGDSVFIMDPWLWLLLGGGWLASRRATVGLIVAFVIISGLLTWIVAARDPRYVLIVVLVAAVLLGALLWRPKRPLATTALVLAACYIGARLLVHAVTEREVRSQIAGAEQVMVAPHPIDPLKWQVVAEVGDEYRHGGFTWRGRALRLDPLRLPVPKETPEWNAARRDPAVRGFMTWVRFPWYEIVPEPSGTRVLIHDARYVTRYRPGGGFGGVEVLVRTPVP